MTSIVTVNVTQTIAPTPATLQECGALISMGATVNAPNTVSLLTEFADLTPLLKGALALTSITWSGGVATVTTAAVHGIPIGDTLLLTIAGETPAAYNGTFPCTVTGTSTFTYPLASNPGSQTVAGVWTPEDVAELVAMATTFFSQGSSTAVSVLELGDIDVTDAVGVLAAYIIANPNANYTPGDTGYFYSYLVPRSWDGNAAFLALIADFEATTSKTYFFVTTTLQNYALYDNLMKCVVLLIESPQMQVYATKAISAAAWASTAGGQVTFTTASAHGITVGTWFKIAGMTPAGYNGWFQAVLGTTGSTLIAQLATDPGAESVLGTLLASTTVSAAPTSTEFGHASDYYVSLHYHPSTTNKVAPFAFQFLVGVTAFPKKGLSALLSTLKAAAVNIIGTGAEGGISKTILQWGVTKDNRDFTYWYSVDWVQINIDLDLSNEIINGSNNPLAPLYYNQAGINRLQARAQATMVRGVAYGLVLALPVVTAVPFIDYVTINESDYLIGAYNGLAVVYTPARGFISILFNVNVTDFPTA